jgi:ribosome assembly protein 3
VHSPRGRYLHGQVCRAVTIPVRKPKAAAPASAEEDESESSPSSSSSDEDEDNSASSEEDAAAIPIFSSSKLGRTDLKNNEPPPHRHSPSPSPPPTADIPPFIPQDTAEGERTLKERFRKFWMASLAEGFKDDLEEIRKVGESSLGRTCAVT